MNIIKHIPNSITSMNLLCGLMGVIFTFNGEFDIAFILMLAAAVCDFCDGLAARLLGAYSDMGKELDSLADMVSFGALPALMAHRLMIYAGQEGFITYIPLLIGIFSALRLAKFNIDDRQTENFIGLPTPACAMICGSFVYYVTKTPDSIMYEWAASSIFIPTVSVILSVLLVIELPMFSMKIKKNNKESSPVNRWRICFIGFIIAEAIAVLVIGLNWSLIILLAFVFYILMNSVLFLICRNKQ